MIILAHRGVWQQKQEQNSFESFRQSRAMGVGIETDLRWRDGKIILMHDAHSDAACVTLEELLALYEGAGPECTLALNIKEDGLQPYVKALLARYHCEHYFVFDMSLPDMLGYLKHDIHAYTRSSEYEPSPLLLERCKGIWADAFENDIEDAGALQTLLAPGKSVAFVSPELHKRPHEAFWSILRETYTQLSHEDRNRMLLCTDFPAQAKAFFGELA